MEREVGLDLVFFWFSSIWQTEVMGMDVEFLLWDMQILKANSDTSQRFRGFYSRNYVKE